ncbi:MAG: hypothetical protein AAF919_12755 [Pseudomonadota bacterium]
MDIAIHLGAHCTDEDRILRTLLRNRPALNEAKVTIPAPGRARPAIRQALRARSGDLAAGFGESFLETIADDVGADRMILSYEGFLGIYAQVLNGHGMYAEAGNRAQGLRDLFAGHRLGFHLAIRNPATFVPAIFDASTVVSFRDFVEGQDLNTLLWRPVVTAILEACPGIPLTVWCNEDLPLIWTEVLRRVSGLPGPFDGDDAILRDVLTEDGVGQLDARLAQNAPTGLDDWSVLAADLLSRHADPEKVEAEIDLPGWSDEVIAGLSALYTADVAHIRDIPGVIFIDP